MSYDLLHKDLWWGKNKYVDKYVSSMQFWFKLKQRNESLFFALQKPIQIFFAVFLILSYSCF